MKIKSDINVWDYFQNTLLVKGTKHHYYYDRNPLDKVVELEDTDFIKCIAICKQFKKYPLKKEIELDYKDFNQGHNPGNASNYLEKFKHSISNQRKYTNTAVEIRRIVNETFAKEFKLLDNLNKLAELHSSFNRVEAAYLEKKEEYETAVNQLETFKTLKNSGLSPEEFSWDVLEPVEQPEE